MYSYKDRNKAVNLYLKYESCTAVIKELEYPSSRTTLIKWVKEFKENNKLIKTSTRTPKYTENEKMAAVKYYTEHGKCVSKTIRDLGYPSRFLLNQWINEKIPSKKKYRKPIKSVGYLSEEEKKDAVIELCAKEDKAKVVASKYNITSTSLYNWKHKMFGDKEVLPMSKNNKSDIIKLESKKQDLERKLEEMEKMHDEFAKKLYRMQLEYDVLKVA